MISEHISQMFLYDIRDDIRYDIKDDIRYDIRYDIKYDIIHDGKVSAPTAETALHRALSKSRSAGPSAGCFEIGDGDLAPSSTSPGSSSAFDASGRGVVCPSTPALVNWRF